MYRDISYLQYQSHPHHAPYTETKCVFYILSASVQQALFSRTQDVSISGAVYHHRDHMRYLVSLMSANLAGLPDGGGVSGEVGAGVGSTVIAAIGSPKTFRSGGVNHVRERFGFWPTGHSRDSEPAVWSGELGYFEMQ